ncbi:imidazoleglycerol-phosphate dehydratase [Sulfodiicoccus acidiphilus]|uniref:Imidazoleglycerol-phosphate dehydratase n=1 Tax=Sulfodiicoccus acidiphilus TaxID=1670455 RepID=A0A348B731_9CREN|nr:imidazoleglycerol-phosphate dehydratase [Sulfodiicoccus acidiphilus]GGU02660.1 imidazoleglycerol-phosphate dehydratase [Sulfodiicoccus acidiphilus]
MSIDIDSPGPIEVKTPVPFLNHMLYTLLFYMRTSATLSATDKLGYDDHHVVEDCAIVLGDALRELLGDRASIARFASVVVPMDDALVLAAVDISGRGEGFVKLDLSRENIGGMSTENVEHFMKTLARRAEVTLHLRQLDGSNVHHIIEAGFKAVGMALYQATRKTEEGVFSTKGML